MYSCIQQSKWHHSATIKLVPALFSHIRKTYLSYCEHMSMSMSYGLACFQQAPGGVHHPSGILQAPRQQRIIRCGWQQCRTRPYGYTTFRGTCTVHIVHCIFSCSGTRFCKMPLAQ